MWCAVIEFCRIVFCRNIYKSLDELRRDLDTWMKEHCKAGSALRHCISGKDSRKLMRKDVTRLHSKVTMTGDVTHQDRSGVILRVLPLLKIVLRFAVVLLIVVAPSAFGESPTTDSSGAISQIEQNDTTSLSGIGFSSIDTSLGGVLLSIPFTLLAWAGIFFIARFLYLKTKASGLQVVSYPEKYFKHDLLWALAIYTILTLLYFRSCLPTFTTHLIGPPEDNMVVYWNLWWANDKVLHGIESLTFANRIYYPEGSSLYYVAWSFYNLILVWGLRLFLGACTVYNLIMLHSFPIAGIGAFLLTKYITKSSYLALLGGFLFAFCPSHFARAQHHIHINTIQFIPFFVLYYLRAVRESSAKMLWLAALFFLLNALADWNYMVFAGFFMFFWYLYQGFSRRRMFMPDLLGRNSLIVGSTLLVLLPWIWPMVRVGLQHPEVTYFGHNTCVVDFFGLFVPGSYHWLNSLDLIDSINRSYTSNPWEIASYLGLISILLVAISFRTIVARHADIMLISFGFLIISFGATLHFGGLVSPVFMPEASFKFLPVLSNVRAPSRFIIYVYLFWSVLVVVALQLLAAKVKPGWLRKAVFIVVPFLLFIDYYSAKVDKTEVMLPPCYELIRKDTDSFAILDLPLAYDPSCYYMMHQALSDIPTVNGSITRQVGQSLLSRLELNDLSRQKKQLLMNNVKYIVIYKQLPFAENLHIDHYRDAYEAFYEDDMNLVLSVR
jgi:hypothetical protein